MTNKRIPAPIIGLLSNFFPDYYTHNEINSLFLTAGAPEDIPLGSKPTKVTSWLRLINQECETPLEVLGRILEDYMDAESPDEQTYHQRLYNTIEEAQEAYNKPRDRLRNALAKDGLQYGRGGHITTGQGFSTKTLMERVQKEGLSAIDIEVKRALDNVEKDPPSAVLAAGAVLEAVFKTYLEQKNVKFYEKDTFSSLWKKCSSHIGMNPKEIEDEDLKKILSGLHDIADGLMHLRNRKSASHGKSDKQMKFYRIETRHARLAVHAAHTLASYILDVMERRDHHVEVARSNT